MADLVTHLSTVLLPASLVRHRAIPMLALGVVLPDLASRLPAEISQRLRELGAPISNWVIASFGACHEPIPLLCLCGIVALAFVPRDRAVVFAALALGAACHLGLDLLQSHHGHGYRLLFPLSLADWELGWMDSEGTVRWAPWLGLWTAEAWALRWLLQRDEGPSAR